MPCQPCLAFSLKNVMHEEQIKLKSLFMFQSNMTHATPKRTFATLRTIWALMLREMSTTYGRSLLGYLWAVMEPAAGVLLLTWIFSIGFRSPPMGTNFALFYATGFIPFTAYMTTSSKVAASLRFSKSLLMYPAVTIVDALLGRYILNLLTQTAVGAIILSAIIFGNGLAVIVNFHALFLGVVYIMAFSLGVGVLNCYLLTKFPTWDQLWSIVTRPLFLVSCVIFVFDMVPMPYRDYLWWNPIVHSIGQFRAAFYPTYNADYTSGLYVLLLSTILTTVGLALLIRHHKELMSQI